MGHDPTTGPRDTPRSYPAAMRCASRFYDWRCQREWGHTGLHEHGDASGVAAWERGSNEWRQLPTSLLGRLRERLRRLWLWP